MPDYRRLRGGDGRCSAPAIAGKGIANPYATIESTRMMFEWLGHNRGIKEAVEAAGPMKRGIDHANPAGISAAPAAPRT